MNEVIHGDTLETVRTLESDSVDCVITSPPYYQLRDYGFSGQWGLEKTYQEYLDKMIALMSELKRVLKPTGTCWVNLGDSYNSHSTGKGNVGGIEGKRKNKQDNSVNKNKTANQAPDKSLMLIPHRFAIRCIDELNLILRNDIVWAKRNGMPESVTDRFSKKHEFFFLFAKQQKYYFDLDGVREKQKDVSIKRYQYDFTGQEGGNSGNMKGVKMRDKSKENYGTAFLQPLGKGERPEWNINGKNPGDVSDFWDINTKPSKSNHYATYNTQLIDKPIIAGCPENGIILDPFCGTGTTLVRAMQLRRNAIGIEGKLEYVKQATKNIEPYLIQENIFNKVI